MAKKSGKKAKSKTVNVVVSKSTLVLAVILAFALLLRVHYLIGLGFADDYGYVAIAHSIMQGKYVPTSNVFSLRLMIVYPTAAFMSVLGVGDAGAAAFPLACSLAGIVLAYFFGKLFHSARAGLVAAALTAVYPLDAIYATRVMPDIPLMLFINASILLLFLAVGLDTPAVKQARKKFAKLFRIKKSNVQAALLFSSGVLLGAAYLAKAVAATTVVFIGPYLAYHVFFSKKVSWKTAAYFAAGLLLVAALESAYLHYAAQDAMLRVKTLQGSYTKDRYQGDRLSDVLHYYPMLMLNRHHSFFRHLFAYIYYLVPPAILYLLFRKNKKALPLLAWLLIIFAYLQVGSMSFTEYRIMEKHERFLTLIQLPSILLLSMALSDAKSLAGKVFALLVILLLASTCLTELSEAFAWFDTPVRDFKNMKLVLDGLPHKTVYADTDTERMLEYHYGFARNAEIRSFEHGVSAESQLKDSYVILNGSMMTALDEHARGRVPEFMRDPPEGWTLVAEVDGRSVGPQAHYDPLIYQTPG